ncbi:MAG: tetratricopeptide repeat protein [Planctomycetota bacterium]
MRCDLLPDEGGGHYDYARLCRRLGDSEAALAAARRAWELLPGDDEVVELLQSLLDGVGELEAFADLVGDLLQVHPDEHWLRGFLAERLMSAGHPDVAEAVLDELVRRAPRSVAGHLQRAQVRVARDDLAGARADFSRVLELRPEDVAARQNRGLVCLQQGALVDALHDFARALREGRDTLDVRMGLAQTLGILGRRLEARQYLGDYLRRHPREAQADMLEFLLRELR